MVVDSSESYLNLLVPRVQLAFGRVLPEGLSGEIVFEQDDQGVRVSVDGQEVYRIPKYRLRRFWDDDAYAAIDNEGLVAAQKVIEHCSGVRKSDG